MQVYSRGYAQSYHEMLGNQVEKRMRASIKQVADFWFTAWVDAGQPDLDALLDQKFTQEDIKEMEEERKEWQLKTIPVRPEETTLQTPAPLWYGTCCHHTHETETDKTH